MREPFFNKVAEKASKSNGTGLFVYPSSIEYHTQSGAENKRSIMQCIEVRGADGSFERTFFPRALSETRS